MFSIYMHYGREEVSDYAKKFDTKQQAWHWLKRCIARARQIGYCLDVEVSHGDKVIYDAFYDSDGKVYVR